LAPAYTRAAVEKNPDCLLALLASYPNLPDEADAFAQADWELHHQLTVCSGNPVFTLILNGFQDLYPAMGQRYFQHPKARDASRQFYTGLLDCLQTRDSALAESIARRAMQVATELWTSMAKG